MYTFLLGLHNLLRWVILLLLLVNLLRHFTAINKPFSEVDKKLGLFLMIFAHIQLVIGLYQWLVGGFGLQSFRNDGAAVMQNSLERFYAVEHTVTMIIAITLITFARGIYRKALPDGKKHRRCILLYAVALLLILAMVPWPGMDDISRSMIPTFK